MRNISAPCRRTTKLYARQQNEISLDEVKRILTAMQTADANACACPVNWQPGEKVIVPPPKTMNEVSERLASNHEKIDFYLMKRDL